MLLPNVTGPCSLLKLPLADQCWSWKTRKARANHRLGGGGGDDNDNVQTLNRRGSFVQWDSAYAPGVSEVDQACGHWRIGTEPGRRGRRCVRRSHATGDGVGSPRATG